MLAAVDIAREQQHAARRAEHKHDADHCFLDLGPNALGPGQQQCSAQRSRERGDLHGGALGLEPELVGE